MKELEEMFKRHLEMSEKQLETAKKQVELDEKVLARLQSRFVRHMQTYDTILNSNFFKKRGFLKLKYGRLTNKLEKELIVFGKRLQKSKEHKNMCETMLERRKEQCSKIEALA